MLYNTPDNSTNIKEINNYLDNTYNKNTSY